VIGRRDTTPLIRQGRVSLPIADVQDRFSDVVAGSGLDYLVRVVAAGQRRDPDSAR
jgi:hypothetical protein